MSCLFCRVVAGELPSRQVHADEHAVAFLDIAPLHRGHTLVVPRRHVEDLLDGAGTWTEIAPAVETTARLLRERLGCAGMNVFSSAGAVAGQEVPHLHVHLVPRYPEHPGLRALLERRADPDELDAVHARLTGSAG
ncbi:HIT domain-containing protein [Auraticoccus sp. F435]|uniref:HIT domain-containing protein n=1 Tax=Auraticoccus cholistanensis TaxID=2656650 RepID=A0A6A9USF0_9ACTN|nr:HIT domain-containing protein [Auraticoccus cholistanensis]MVA75621.1 HIT domain-containing protein [Auraticoccus cholistanensis]